MAQRCSVAPAALSPYIDEDDRDTVGEQWAVVKSHLGPANITKYREMTSRCAREGPFNFP
jgi:hypothetical protein